MDNKFQIPEKKYFSIGEVAELCDLKTHTLRFWEKEFEGPEPSNKEREQAILSKRRHCLGL